MFTRIDLGQRKDQLLHQPQVNSSSIKKNNCYTTSVRTGQPYWDIYLDRDLVETIVNFYPEWFMEEEPSAIQSDPEPQSLGSPRVVVDEGSLQKAMVKNKESLKVKLLLRRPISQLVEQGILPRK